MIEEGKMESDVRQEECPRCLGRRKVTCDYCHGFGSTPYTDFMPMMLGFIFLMRPVERTRPCPRCYGEGKLRCPRCDGTGFV